MRNLFVLALLPLLFFSCIKDDPAPDPPPVDNFDPDLGPIDDELRAIEALMEDL